MKITTCVQVRDPKFLRQFKAYCSDLFEKQNLGPAGRLDWLTDVYRDLEEPITDGTGAEVFLDMDVFESPNIHFWFRDFCKPISEAQRPRVRSEALARVVALSSILRANDPIGTAHL